MTFAAEQESLLRERLDQVRSALAKHAAAPADTGEHGRVGPGSIVVLNFGSGPETLLFGAIEERRDGAEPLEVVTPESAVGRRIAGREAGDEVLLPSGATVRIVSVGR